jgi:hypothetical protein
VKKDVSTADIQTLHQMFNAFGMQEVEHLAILN